MLNTVERWMSSVNLGLQVLSISRSNSTQFLENKIKILGSIKYFLLGHKHDEDQENIRDHMKLIEESK